LLDYDGKTDLLVVYERRPGRKLNISTACGLRSQRLNSIFFVTLRAQRRCFFTAKNRDQTTLSRLLPWTIFPGLYTHTMEELQDSKARLIADVSAQLKLTYEGQLQICMTNFKNANEFSEMQMALKQDEIRTATVEGSEKALTAYVWVFIVLAIIVAFVLGKFMVDRCRTVVA